MEPTSPNNDIPKPESTTSNPDTAPSQPVAPAAPAEPAQAASGQPHAVIGGADQAQTTAPISQHPVATSGGKKKWLLPVGIAAIVVLLAAGYVFGMYLPNRPSAVYSKGLTNTGKAVDSLVDYTNNVSKMNYKSYGVDGTVKVASSSGSFDGTLKGAFDVHANGNLTVDVDALGQKVNAEIRSVHVNGNASPDVYVKISGVKSYLDSFGASSLDSLDGQWVAVDHTLIDTVAANYSQSKTSATTSLPTSDQVHDALVKVQNVNKQYVFTTDQSKAVFKQDKYVGKETKDGRNVYHYKVSANKANMKAYGSALKSALDSSSLNDWYKKANSGKNLSSSFDTSSLNSTSANSTFDMWIDTKTKLVHAVQFADSSDPSSTLTLAQNYTGGDEYPFELSSADKTTKADLKLTINKATNVSTVALTGNESSTNFTLNVKVTPSNDAVQVTAPSGAQPIMNILSKLGLGSSGL